MKRRELEKGSLRRASCIAKEPLRKEEQGCQESVSSFPMLSRHSDRRESVENGETAACQPLEGRLFCQAGSRIKANRV